jgi:hypothetical protein
MSVIEIVLAENLRTFSGFGGYMLACERCKMENAATIYLMHGELIKLIGMEKFK